MIGAYVRWNIYVRTGSIEKLKKVHLPAIDDRVQATEFAWQIVKEDENAGLFRAINCQNLSADTVSGVIVPVLERAYSLADGWTIYGLGDLGTNSLTHIFGSWSMKVPNNRPPAIESMVFEIEPGFISGMTHDEGWQLDERR